MKLKLLRWQSPSMNLTWQDERKEIAVWLSGYLSMVKRWVDKILDNEDLEVDKNKIVNTLTTWIEYLSEEREKIMMMRNNPIEEQEGEESIEINTKGDYLGE